MDKLRFICISDFDDLFKLEDWIESCMNQVFIDYDGFGNLATLSTVSNIEVRPSQFVYKAKDGRMKRTDYEVPKWASGIVWYNR